MKTRRLTVAQAIVEFLQNQYVEIDGCKTPFVKGVFTIFGHGNVLGLGQALEENPGDLHVLQGRNEQGMAHAAMGFAKQKLRKQIFACTSSIGPGAANMVTAAATASVNRIPVLFLPGDSYAVRQPDPVLQQVEQPYDYNITTNDAFKAVSRYWDRINRPEQTMTAMIHAMRVLTSPADTGAVTICLPQDVQGEAYDFPDSFLAERVHRIERTPATAEMLKEAADAIVGKKKPLLICGGGVRYSEASEEFLKFAEAFNIPIGETQAGKSAVPAANRLNLGGIGTTGNLASNRIARDADLVIGVGTRFSDFTTASKSLFQHPDVEFISINISDFDAYKMDAVKVIADAKVALTQLADELRARGYSSGYNTEIAAAKDAWNEELERLYNLTYTGDDFVPEVKARDEAILPDFFKAFNSRLTETQVLGELNKILDDDAIAVSSAGSLPGDMQRMWNASQPNTYHMEYGFSCMGYEINGALGVKMAAPDQEVYAFVGDGSYMMSHSELVTSIQENQKINILLFDNSSFGCINNLQMGTGMGSFGTEFRYRNSVSGKLDGELMKIDFAMNAAAYGAKTYSVTTMKELRSAVADAKEQTVSTLIDIKVMPKTMTDSYESWWRCGVAEVSQKKEIQTAYAGQQEGIKNARPY